MRWRNWMRAIWPFSQTDSHEAQEALSRAVESGRRAKEDHKLALKMRAQNEEAAEAVRAHNAANRYDEFLRRVVQGHD
jgi:hypothetical protein